MKTFIIICTLLLSVCFTQAQTICYRVGDSIPPTKVNIKKARVFKTKYFYRYENVDYRVYMRHNQQFIIYMPRKGTQYSHTLMLCDETTLATN